MDCSGRIGNEGGSATTRTRSVGHGRNALASWPAAAVVGVVVCAGGCANTLMQNQAAAMRTAETRAKFELNCPTVESTLLSQKLVQGFRFEGSEYTIGVRGVREASGVRHAVPR
jgi:hypothetical protein